MADPKPMISLEPNPAHVPELCYNVPEPTSYTGQNFIELNFVPTGEDARTYFKPECFEEKNKEQKKELEEIVKSDQEELKKKIETNFKRGVTNSIFTNGVMHRGTMALKEKAGSGAVIESNVPLSKGLQKLDLDEVSSQVKNGMKLNVFKNLYGTLTYNYIPAKPKVLRPRIVLIETYKLSSFLGKYGAGKTIKTFSLLPGEKTKISIKTYLKTETSAKQASSILDSFTEESSDDFESSMASENSTKQNEAESFEYHAEAEASGSWGWGSAKVSGGVKGSTNSSREEFAKNTASATTKHANKASAKRDVQINTSQEVNRSMGEESEIVREIENINTSRTLNFVFRQMNQEFIVLLHLTDLRLGYFNGENISKREFTLPEIDDLLSEVIIQEKKEDVKKAILNEILNIKDYKGHDPKAVTEAGDDTAEAFISEKALLDANNQPSTKYYQFAKDLYSKYSDGNGNEFSVKGILLNANKCVMRTDGVIVDSILGEGIALDQYSQELQLATNLERKLRNDKLAAEVDNLKIINELLKEADPDKKDLILSVLSSMNSKSNNNG